jgi:hypothetical protein
LFLLDHEAERHAMRKRAYLYGREMIWPKVAQRYLESFERARAERFYRPQALFIMPGLASLSAPFPPITLKHVWRLTDETGMFQHAIYTLPNYLEGYCTDDNARALALAVLLEEHGEDWSGQARALASRYLAFLWGAFNAETGHFRNFLGYDRRWLEEVGSDDSQGRALQNLGLLLGRSEQDDLRGVAIRLFEAALPGALELGYPRAWAFSLLGVHEYLSRFTGDRRAQHVLTTLAEQLLERYHLNQSPDWPWFEDALTYCNAALPHALLVSGQHLMMPDMIAIALNSLQWLVDQQRSEYGHFAPIGCHGFCPRDGEKARFDQQPVEAQCLISACLEAWRLTNNTAWYSNAEWAFEWFLGRNDVGLPLYDPISGGCHDGLRPDRLNQNQGAESTLAFLLSLVELRQAQKLRLPMLETMPRPALLHLEISTPRLEKK